MKDRVALRSVFPLASAAEDLAQFKLKLTATMAIDFAGCWVIEVVCKHLFADLKPKVMITRGSEHRAKQRSSGKFKDQ